MGAQVKYKRIETGEWFKVSRGGHKISCCDCGLVHDFHFRTRGGDLEIQMNRNERSTGQMRRNMKDSVLTSILEGKKCR